MAQTISVLSIDIATPVFHIVGMDDRGHVGRRQRLARRALLPLMANVPPGRIGMDACGSAPYWARRCRAQGHDGRLIAPPFVKASGKSPQHEARDAEASCEAVTRPTRRCVPINRVAPPDLHALHRSRARRSKARTAVVHEMRGLLSEDGMMLPHSLAKVRALIVAKLEEEQAQLTALGPEVFGHLDEEWLAVGNRLAYDDEKLAALGQAHPACQRRQTIAGMGPVTATALIAAIGDAPQFQNGRPLSAWLGLGPRAHSTGGKPRGLGLSKRGDVSRRKRWSHGARATLRWIATKHEERRQWLTALMARRGQTRAAVALAHKNARRVWALLAHHQA